MNIKPPADLETRAFIMEHGALSHIPALLQQYWPDKAAWIVADENTWKVGGTQLSATLQRGKIKVLSPFIFPGAPTLDADIKHARQLIENMSAECAPIVLGSGTLNDLLKYAASERQTKYLVVPTATSMDGYNASGAALLVDGFKQTMPCAAPLAVVADPAIMATAPAEMFAAGYGDLLAKIPAGADWIIADYLGLHPIRNDVWQMIQVPLRNWLQLPASVEAVFEGLIATGYAMQMCHDSRPASGAEHLISHVWEMEGVTASHGFKVGLATLAITAMFEELLQYDTIQLKQWPPSIKTADEREQEANRLLGNNSYAETIKKIAMKKFVTGQTLQERREKIYAHWDLLRSKLAAQLLSFAEIKNKLSSVNAPTTPDMLKIPAAQFISAFAKAQLIRNRYTILDLVYDLGLPLKDIGAKIYQRLLR